MSQGIEFSDAAKLREFMVTDRMAVILQLAPIILAHVLTLLAAWFVVTRYRTYSFRQMLGWKMNGFKIWHAVLIFVGFYAVAVALTTIFGEVENDFEKLVKTSRTAVYLVAFFATFTAPLVEEVVYRGLLYSAFFKKFGMTAAVILVTLIFTGVHVPQYSMDAIPDLATVITLLLLSLTLTLIRAWTGQLLPSIVLHTVINGIQAILLIAAPYLPTDTTPISPPTGLISWLLK